MLNVKFAEPAIIGLPDKQLLIDRLSYALDFAKRAVQHLIIAEHGASEDTPWYVRPEKIIAETAFLMIFAKAGKEYMQIEEALTSLALDLEPLARSNAMLLNICLKPALALDYAHAHICLGYLGYPNEHFDVALKDALNSEAAMGIERMPYRMLEREWLLSIWDNQHSTEGQKFWIPISCLNRPIDIFSESSDGVYALTHAVMYTFFQGKKVLDIGVKELIELVEALVVRYMDEQDYDIVGELLIIWPLLGEKMSPTAAFALDCLLKIEERVGFLPAPGLNTSMIEGKEQQARRTYIYSINYHTALVMGLLCATLLEQIDNLEEKEEVGNGLYLNKLRRWLNHELVGGKSSHWIDYFSKLNNQQKRSLLPWVYQSILSRRVKERKYGEVKKIIELSKDSDLESLAMTRQAKELLHRLSKNVSGMITDHGDKSIIKV